MKLQTIHATLRGNPDVTFIDVVDQRQWYRFGGPQHTVDFLIAPTNGLYTALELQDFMMALVPHVEPIEVEDFEETVTSLRFGKLVYTEKIGEAKVTHTFSIDDEDLLSALNASAPKSKLPGRPLDSVVTNDLGRRITVRPFPCADYLQDVNMGKYLHVLPINTDKQAGLGTILSYRTRALTGSIPPPGASFK